MFASVLPVEVEIELINGAGKKRTFTISNDKIERVGIHQDYDVALFKMQLPSGYKVQRGALSKEPVETGTSAYAIGNPTGVNVVLQKTITKAMISSANKVIDGRSYYGLSAIAVYLSTNSDRILALTI